MCGRLAALAAAGLLLLQPFGSSVAAQQNDAYDDGASYGGEGAGGGADEAIPDKVGAEVHLAKSERKTLEKIECSMCKAIIKEMHKEVKKHSMTQKGWGSETQVWETSNAICLAMLQKYQLDLKREKLNAKPEDEDDQEAMMKSGMDGADFMRAMLVLKMGCQRWVEDYGGDTSGYVYKSVKGELNTPDGAAQDFCVQHVNQCGSKKKEKRKKQKDEDKVRVQKRHALAQKEEKIETKRKDDNPLEKLPEDSKLGLQRMLEMAKDDPMHYMEDDAKQRVLKGRKELRCDVCRAVLEEVHAGVANKPKSMRREYDILPLAENACEGGRDLSVPNYFGVEPPPLPPVWTDRYRPRLQKQTSRYSLRRFPKKAAAQRRKWRELSADGRQKPPSPEEGEGDMMLTLACKDVAEPARVAEVLFEQMTSCERGASASCDPVIASARLFCRTADDAPCNFEENGKTSGPAAEKGGEEL